MSILASLASPCGDGLHSLHGFHKELESRLAKCSSFQRGECGEGPVTAALDEDEDVLLRQEQDQEQQQQQQELVQTDQSNIVFIEGEDDPHRRGLGRPGIPPPAEPAVSLPVKFRRTLANNFVR